MRKTAISFLFAGSLLFTGAGTMAQTKMGCISESELLSSMPEVRKADTTLAQYKEALEQQFDAFKTEYSAQVSLLTSRDTGKFTRPQLELKRKSLAELLAKLQGFDQQAGMLLDQKKSDLFQPIQKKAEDAIQQVSKDYGYAYVFEKDNLHAYPPSDDILPLVKKRLGLQ